MSRDPFVSYAQNQEDVVLARALRPDDRQGFWVDVGAGDPVLDSVTAAFAERGWRGVNVEPLPREHERLCAARPADTNLRVALGATAGHGKLFVEPTEKPKWPDPDAPIDRGASTMVPEIAERYRADGQEFTPIEVPIWTLAQVVADHVRGPVDFLKVDVEGFEREVLAGADWSSFRPRVVVMEATVPKSDEPAHEAWEPILLEAGYRLRHVRRAQSLLCPRRRAGALADARHPRQRVRRLRPVRVGAPGRPGTTVGTPPGGQRSPTRNKNSTSSTRVRHAHARQPATTHDQAAIAAESTARALAEAHRVRTELHALRATRTVRYTASLGSI